MSVYLTILLAVVGKLVLVVVKAKVVLLVAVKVEVEL